MTLKLYVLKEEVLGNDLGSKIFSEQFESFDMNAQKNTKRKITHFSDASSPFGVRRATSATTNPGGGAGGHRGTMTRKTLESKAAQPALVELFVLAQILDCFRAQRGSQREGTEAHAHARSDFAGFGQAPGNCISDPGTLVCQPRSTSTPPPGAPKFKYRGLHEGRARLEAPGAPEPKRRIIDPLAAAHCLADACFYE